MDATSLYNRPSMPHQPVPLTIICTLPKGHSTYLILATDPPKSVAFLTRELRTVPRGTYYPGKKSIEEQHVVACLRALRYLTGITFSAKTAAQLTDDEKQFLDFRNEMHDNNPTH